MWQFGGGVAHYADVLTRRQEPIRGAAGVHAVCLAAIRSRKLWGGCFPAAAPSNITLVIETPKCQAETCPLQPAQRAEQCLAER